MAAGIYRALMGRVRRSSHIQAGENRDDVLYSTLVRSALLFAMCLFVWFPLVLRIHYLIPRGHLR